MAEPLLLALPSKGRLHDATEELFARVGMTITRTGAERAYRGHLASAGDVSVTFLSAPEIVRALRESTVDAGITGEDLLRDGLSDEHEVEIMPLGFGSADVVVAVPECWFDVATMNDLDEVSALFYQRHGRRLRVATKFLSLTRRFFAEKGLAGYRIVESAGATEGAPAAGAAEVVVDITTSGSTLRANRLKVLDDGLILRSQAVLASRKGVMADPRAKSIAGRLSAAIGHHSSQ
jgi:ATP phosphoribosyltransferase